MGQIDTNVGTLTTTFDGLFCHDRCWSGAASLRRYRCRVIRTRLEPVFAGLRVGLHALIVGLALLVMVRAAYGDARVGLTVVCVSILFLGTYGVGGFLLEPRHRFAPLWIAALTAQWLVLVWLTPDAAYLVFPLFFLYLHLLSGWRGPVAVAASAAAAIAILGMHNGFTAGAVIGPAIGAAVAIGFGLGYRALYRESAERQRLIDELRATQELLAATEREKGIVDERTRLAAEIHDTVAQGLSSIQMLLYAAERAAPKSAGNEHVVLARNTASDSLIEARRLIRELSPASLVGATLTGALQRTASDMGRMHDFATELVVVGQPAALPMAIESAIVRLTQSTLGNVAKHASCSRARVTLSYLEGEVRLDVVDDGCGFDPAVATQRQPDSDSFGFDVMRQRVERLGGTLVVESAAGGGTAISAAFEVDS